ncbi:PspA-associated protein PspAA [Amycolatopsis alkalitolerans]|uniref:PspA-associated domain-containing protein n=1 Tax=Amycolatopsis alkalitolerans TaxID=2547244 RepID=A0A5C4LYF9_9PSEU|nr:hypothetical protein [Amycolatopsis alkalitolerans]TNC24143.1 hypothetical protein FG385_18990 [Amycolatopsis alkalitolerans]
MIIRILGQGQYDVAEDRIEELNTLDTELQVAVDAGDTAAFATALRALTGAVRKLGAQLPEDSLVASELVLPGEDSSLEHVRALLSDEGLIPG